VETRRLMAFIKMVDLGSLTRAADRLGIAQPALSQQVAALEHEFGAQLLVRNSRGVTPTPAGLALYRHANTVLKQLENARAEIRHAGNKLAGAVSLGMPFSLSEIVAAPLLQSARVRYPQIKLHLVDSLPGNLICEKTLNGQLDLALLTSASPTQGLTLRRLFTQRFLFACSPEVRLQFDSDSVSVINLQNHPLVLPTRGNRLRQAVDEAFSSRDLTPNVVAELDSLEGVRAVTAAGVASTIIPWSPQIPSPRLATMRIEDPTIERDIFLATLTSAPLTSAAEAVRELLVEVVGDAVQSNEWLAVGAPSAEQCEDS
jgi:LysR family transcriptional regulator, nitrogen assimilation regulatory protein